MGASGKAITKYVVNAIKARKTDVQGICGYISKSFALNEKKDNIQLRINLLLDSNSRLLDCNSKDTRTTQNINSDHVTENSKDLFMSDAKTPFPQHSLETPKSKNF